MKFFDTTIRSFNLEITNRCVLACPACPRTGNPWVLDHLTDLPLEILQRAFPLSAAETFAGVRLNLCGAHGDCVYHPAFHDVVRHLKAAGFSLNVETNGSHRKPKWWEKTCDLLDDDDVVTFSVDGLRDTNDRYRVNARWDDIEGAMRICAARVPVVWKCILFAHNEHQVDDIRALAADVGIRDLILKKSGRFAEDDPLAPSDDAYIGVVTRNRRRIESLRAGPEPASAARFDAEVEILPRCRHGKDIAITARGFVYPCTSCESQDMREWFQTNREHFDLRRHDLEQILGSPKWRELESLWLTPSTAPDACVYYCGVHRDYRDLYAQDSRPDRPFKPQDAIIVELAS